jgi:hypothetical protein
VQPTIRATRRHPLHAPSHMRLIETSAVALQGSLLQLRAQAFLEPTRCQLHVERTKPGIARRPLYKQSPAFLLAAAREETFVHGVSAPSAARWSHFPATGARPRPDATEAAAAARTTCWAEEATTRSINGSQEASDWRRVRSKKLRMSSIPEDDIRDAELRDAGSNDDDELEDEVAEVDVDLYRSGSGLWRPTKPIRLVPCASASAPRAACFFAASSSGLVFLR